jgi:hypothetical protein
VNRCYNYLLEKNNLNYFDNPLKLYNENQGCIAYDNGYDGENGSMDCWRLEENSRTSYKEISLADVFEYNSWDIKRITREQFNELMDIAQIFCNVGLNVYFVSLLIFNKGYDYNVIQFTPNNLEYTKSMISEICGKDIYLEIEYFRIYISKEY